MAYGSADRFWRKFNRAAGRFWLLAAFGLAACSGLTPNRPVTQGASVVETPAGSLVETQAATLSPAPSPGATQAPVSLETAVLVETPAPGKSGFPGKYTPTIEFPSPADEPVVPGGKATATMQPAAVGDLPAAAASFADCARTPGLVTCDSQAAALTGRLAFADPSAARLIALDLQNGAGWQSQAGKGKPEKMDWSPDGKKLLVGLGERDYVVFSAEGKALETFHSEGGAAWQPDGSLSKDGTLAQKDGASARLEYTPNQTWVLHLKPAQGEERVLPLDAPATDQIYDLRSWIPGTQKLLAQRYTASNSAMLFGGELLVLTPGAQTVSIQALKVTAPLGSDAGLVWDPTQAGQLAFIASGGDQGERRLALWDATSGQIRYPLPVGVQVSSIDWSPAGSPEAGKLAFAALPVEPLSPPEASKIFSGPGIYLLDPKGGEAKPLVLSPKGMEDGWPHWSGDGAALVYARTLVTQNGGTSGQVRAHQVKDGKDWLLVQGIAGPEEAILPAPWERWLAFGMK